MPTKDTTKHIESPINIPQNEETKETKVLTNDKKQYPDFLKQKKLCNKYFPSYMMSKDQLLSIDRKHSPLFFGSNPNYCELQSTRNKHKIINTENSVNRRDAWMMELAKDKFTLFKNQEKFKPQLVLMEI